MRLSPSILLSLLAITPVVVVSAPAPAPAPQDATPAVASGATDAASAAGSGTSTGKTCTRGRGRGRPGQVQPTDSAIPSDSAATSSSEVAASPPAESPPAESPAPVEGTPVQETPAPSTPEPSVADGVNLVATDQGGDQQSAGGDAQPTGNANANAGADAGASGDSQAAEPSASDPSPPATSDSDSGSSSGTGSDSASGGPAEGFEADILKAHNEARAKFNAPPMTWDANSTKIAHDHYTSTGCVMEHGLLGFGENLVSVAESGQKAVDDWMSEEPDWHPGMESENETGHFTQLVWKASTKLGCVAITCEGGTSITACEYSPAGNMKGEYAQNVGKT